MAWMWENVRKEQERCSGWVELLMWQREDLSAQRWEGLSLSQAPRAPSHFPAWAMCLQPGLVGGAEWL